MFFEKFFTKTVSYSFYILFFLTPLILTPFNYELFEFNKMTFVYLMTVIITGSWIAKMIITGKIKIKRTPLDIPIILYLLSSILSTIFSIHPYTSLWGYYSRFHGGLMSTTSYILLYYAFTSNFNLKKTKKAINILLLSALIVSTYGVLERLGIDDQYWVQDVKNRVFSTLGQPNWLGAFIDSLIFIPLAFFLTKTSKKTKSLSLITFIILFLCLIFTNSKSSILAFWLILIFFLLILKLLKKADLKKISILFFLSLIVYILLGAKTYNYIKKAPLWLNIFTNKKVVQSTKATPTLSKTPTTSPLKYPQNVSESSQIRKIVWQGAVEIWRNYPIFGSGVETFGYSFYNFRPVEQNLLSEWDFLYNKAHNEFLNILACQGAVGLISYLLLILSFLLFILKNIKKQTALILALFSGYLTILITSFFGFSVVIIGLLFFLIPAFCFTLFKNQSKNTITISFLKIDKYTKTDKEINLIQKTLLILLIFFIAYLLYFIINLWRADYFFSKGEKYFNSNYLLNSLIELETAINLNPNQALYHNQLSQTAAKLAATYKEAEATDSAEIIGQLEELALKENEITLILNPVHLNFYKSSAKVYVYLSYLNGDYTNKAIDILLKAAKLAPTDAKILYNIGLLYQQVDETDKAEAVWLKAVKLKPNYRRVYIKLAQLYLKKDQPTKAKEKLLFVQKNIDLNDQQVNEMLDQLKELNKQI